MTTKTFKIYWIFDGSKHTDVLTEGYVGSTTQSIKKRFEGHKRNKFSGQSNTTSNTMRHMSKFIEECVDPQVVEICRTKDEDMSTKIELLLRPEPGIGWNKHKGGKRNGVQKPIQCTTEDGETIDYVSLSQGSRDGFHLGGIQSCLNGSSKYTSHSVYGKCVFTYK